MLWVTKAITQITKLMKETNQEICIPTEMIVSMSLQKNPTQFVEV